MAIKINEIVKDEETRPGTTYEYKVDGRTFIVRSLFKDKGEDLYDILAKLLKYEVENS